MTTVTLMVIWFLTIIGATVVLNAIYDFVDEALSRRKKQRAAEAFQLRCKEAELKANIDMLEQRIEWGERDLELQKCIIEINRDINEAIKIYKELDTHNEAKDMD